MMKEFPNGVWPTMITPFTANNRVDYKAVEQLVNWYLENGSDGLFSTCQSSEAFYLSLKERVELTRFVKQAAGDRAPVIASGHVSYEIGDQIEELNAVAQAGADAVILITNRLAGEYESDEIMIENLHRILEALPPELPLGFYECPYPYKRLLTPKVIKFCLSTGRFYFLKDTSCHLDQITEKLELIKGSCMKLYNANTTTLLASLRLGASGYSGVMANFQPQLYAWLYKNWEKDPDGAFTLQAILTMCSLIELKNYPACAKYALTLNGLQMTDVTRKTNFVPADSTFLMELEQINHLTQVLSRHYSWNP